MNDAGILFSFEDGIARITLNRPERLNSFTNAMHEAMFASLCSVERNPALRMVQRWLRKFGQLDKWRPCFTISVAGPNTGARA